MPRPIAIRLIQSMIFRPSNRLDLAILEPRKPNACAIFITGFILESYNLLLNFISEIEPLAIPGSRTRATGNLLGAVRNSL
jgi:hypothetical protein